MSSAVRKRTGSGSGAGGGARNPKIVQMYEVLLKAEDPESSSFGDAFWSDFFLMKPKASHFESEFAKLTPDQFVRCRSNLWRLFEESLANLECLSRPIRIVYALQTLCALLKAVFRKQEDGGHDVNALVGCVIVAETAERRMRELLGRLNAFLGGEHPSSLKELCLKLLLIVCCGTDNPSRNPLMEYVAMDGCLFESLVGLLSSDSRQSHGHRVVLVLALLVQYRKNEATNAAENPYAVKLSILDQEMALHGYSQVITNALAAYNAAYRAKHDASSSPAAVAPAQPSSSGWLSSITSIVGNMFVSEDPTGSASGDSSGARNAVLLALYEAVHLNRNFIATLAHYQTEGENSLSTVAAALADEEEPASRPASSNGGDDDEDLSRLSSVPSNLLVTFLEYCSIAMQDIKSEASFATIKLTFLILVCISEDQYANALLNDANLVFRVRLHHAPTRHRKAHSHWGDAAAASLSRPLACSVMDLMVEFTRSHMMKRFPHQLYSNALGIVHRLLSYQKRSKVRLYYPWKELWSCLISLVKFVTSNDLAKKFDVFSVALQAIVIFNLFITYGDTFLASPGSYDELYYELVRCRAVFDGLYALAFRHSTSSGGSSAVGEYKESAVKVANALINIRAITAHFSPKIDAWLAKQQLSTPSEEQILEVVKANYDSLTLKLQEGLDQYERYAECPTHSAFFASMVRDVVADTRNQVVLTDLQLQSVLQDFSTIQ